MGLKFDSLCFFPLSLKGKLPYMGLKFDSHCFFPLSLKGKLPYMGLKFDSHCFFPLSLKGKLPYMELNLEVTIKRNSAHEHDVGIIPTSCSCAEYNNLKNYKLENK